MSTSSGGGDVLCVFLREAGVLWTSSALEDQSLGLAVGSWNALGVLLCHVSLSLASSARNPGCILQDHPGV